MSVYGLFEICIIGCMTGILIVTVELGLIMNTKLIGVVSFYNYVNIVYNQDFGNRNHLHCQPYKYSFI